MNKEHRKNINELIRYIDGLKSQLCEAMETIESIREEEEEYRDNIPENMQGSERYEMADEAVNALTTAYDALEAADSELDEAMDNLEEAKE